MATTWNPADKTASVALTNGNLTATSSSTNQGVRATQSFTSGKVYFEVSFPLMSGFIGLALVGAAFNATTNAVGIGPGSGWIQVNGSSVTNIGTMTTPISIAVDLDGKRIWFRNAPSGNWNGNATYNPATNVGGVDISVLSGALFPAALMMASSDNMTANFGATAFSGTVPAGFSAPDTPVVPPAVTVPSGSSGVGGKAWQRHYSESNDDEMQTVQCPHCGHANPDSAVFCQSCGGKMNPPSFGIGSKQYG